MNNNVSFGKNVEQIHFMRFSQHISDNLKRKTMIDDEGGCGGDFESRDADVRKETLFNLEKYGVSGYSNSIRPLLKEGQND